MKKYILIVLVFIISLTASAISYITLQDLNVRSTNNSQSQSLGVLKKGTEVEVVNLRGDWGEINFNDQVGYLKTKYLAVSTKQSTESRNKEGSKSWLWIILIGGVVFFLLRKTVIGQYVAPELSRIFSTMDKSKSGSREYRRFRCKRCGNVVGTYFKPEVYGCSTSKTHDWRRIE